jgi:hypothetical protein
VPAALGVPEMVPIRLNKNAMTDARKLLEPELN